MTRRVSLRGKLILASGSLALVTTLILASVFHLRTQRQLLHQLDRTLETRCDEVITVLEGPLGGPTLDDFLHIETTSRFIPNTYLYQVRNAQGRTLVRSANLGDGALPLPQIWKHGTQARSVHIRTVHVPGLSTFGDRVRIRSERVEVRPGGGDPETHIIQTAASLVAFDAAVRSTLVGAILFSVSALGVVFFLLWFVTTRALRPVAEITHKASQISAADLRERLPLAGREDELDELATVLNDMLDRLARSLGQMEQFSADAAHQLRTPLTRIRGELELLLRSVQPDAVREQLEKIHAEVERLSRLCARLLLFARLDHHGRDTGTQRDRIDLEELAGELVEQMNPSASERGVRLQLGVTQPVEVRGSRPLLVEAVLNLLDNAVRYTPSGGIVSVTVVRHGARAQLAVTDSGAGIPVDDRERIFQPFFRLAPLGAPESDEGTGLGLAIVRAIATAHGGTIEVVDAAGGGSEFRLALPVASDER